MFHRSVLLLTFAGAMFGQAAGVPGLPTAEDAARLETTLASNPDDVPARMRLLLYYSSAAMSDAERVRPLRRRHILWFIERRPADGVHSIPYMLLDRSGQALADPEGYKLAEAAWRKHLAADAPAPRVYANAIHFFETADPTYAARLAGDGLKRHPRDATVGAAVGRFYALSILGAKGLDRFGRVTAFDEDLAKSDAAQVARRELETATNPDVLSGAADMLVTQSSPLRMRGREAQAAAAATLAQGSLERALKLDPTNQRAPASLRRLYQLAAASERDPALKKELLDKAASLPVDDRTRWYGLSQQARAQFAAGETGKATESASELLSQAPKYPDDWNYGNAIHWGNIVLGQIALKEGKGEESVKRLLAAGATKGSPQLNSFGPDWQLAKNLANKGETGAVLEYLELCRKFWKLDRGALDFWAAALRDGGVPAFSPVEAMSGGRRFDAAFAELVDKPAPELKLKDLAGKTVSLADFKGKIVLLDFWATWCAPCRREMPAFEKLHREFAGKDVVVLTVDADEPEATPAQYMKDEKFTFPVLLAEGTDAVKRWGIVAFPTTFAVDAEGRVTAFAVGGRSEAELRELVAKARK